MSIHLLGGSASLDAPTRGVKREMRIHVFLRSAGQGVEARRKRQVLRCFHRGLLVEGEDAHLIVRQAYESCDVAVVLGGRPSAKRATTQEVRDDIFARHEGAFVFVETPLLGRNVYRPVIVAYARKLLRLGILRGRTDKALLAHGLMQIANAAGTLVACVGLRYKHYRCA